MITQMREKIPSAGMTSVTVRFLSGLSVLE
jgi:hypothetical protein